MKTKKKIKNMKNCGVKSEIQLDQWLKTDEYDEKYMKMKFNSDDELPLNKMIKIPSLIIVARAVFHENDKYYSQVPLEECLYKLQIT